MSLLLEMFTYPFILRAFVAVSYTHLDVYKRQVQHVTLTTQAHIPWSLDGEFAPSVERVDIDNLSGAVELLR